MRLTGYFFLAHRFNKQKVLESLLIILAIGLGVGVVVVTQSYIFSEKRLAEELLAKDSLYVRHASYISSEDFFIEGKHYPFILKDIYAQAVDDLTIKDYYILRDSLEGEALVYYYKKMNLNDINMKLPVVYQTPEFFYAMGLELERGEFFSKEDYALGNEVAVIGADLAMQLFPDEDPIGKVIHMNMWPSYKIIGLLKEITNQRFKRIFGKNGDRYAFVPHSTQTAPPGEYIGGEYIPSPLETIAMERIIIEPLKGNEQLFLLKKLAEETLLINNMDYAFIRGPFRDQDFLSLSLLTVIIINFIAALTLLVAGINIMNLTLARVLKRTKGYGLSLALGAGKKTVLKLIFAEIAYLGLAGGFLGLGLAFFACKYINSAWFGLNLTFGLSELAFGLGISLLLTLLASLYPVLHLRKVNPSEMLRVA